MGRLATTAFQPSDLSLYHLSYPGPPSHRSNIYSNTSSWSTLNAGTRQCTSQPGPQKAAQNQNRQSELFISHSIAAEDSSPQRDDADVSEHATVSDIDTCPAPPLPSHSTGCHFVSQLSLLTSRRYSASHVALGCVRHVNMTTEPTGSESRQ